ncbi:hypothetical protein [Amycolatopsis sp. SID8362]|uniref:hypothetical protein n=1 Tax=Amycolatopsis sp. SID8362 TaxID=2690346 RepID=UPI0013717CB2|nr:hypothetical protein [Amycolatopsis sp. SID8362]NBH07073.1 hypothetical protein [Amycolatopsis sp. SID8362]NED43770.1 hypothetical protein [Amycolatopsis sp. SID8362]
MSDRDSAEPDSLSPSEALDEDELRVDPLEEGVEPPEHWSAANRHGTTPGEIREGEPMKQRLAEEEPDTEPEQVPERPLAATPAAELDETIEDAPPDFEPVSPGDEVPHRHADPDPGERADYAGGSVADAIREARQG